MNDDVTSTLTNAVFSLSDSFTSIILVCVHLHMLCWKYWYFINSNASIDCGTSGEDCNFNCTTKSGGCKTQPSPYIITLISIKLCQNSTSLSLKIYAYNVTNMQLIMNGYLSRNRVYLFIEGTQCDSVNLYCRGSYSCWALNAHPIAPNLKLNVYCHWDGACNWMIRFKS